MTTKHTPGPYRAEAINSPLSTRSGFRIRRDDGGGTDPVLAILYDTPDGEVSAEEARANADLFAAAPDLHAFVRMLARLNASGDNVDGVEWEHDTGDSLDTLDAIVMRARELAGQPHDERASAFRADGET
mgnify:CR=1 FL=1